MILLVFGCVLGLFPLLPALPAGGAAMTDVPHLPWAAGGIAALGIILLLWQRWRGGREPF
ncbi:MAG TPA: hypothetical protein VFP94_04650 [Terriglobales bacterium]|nr:hypothetical protein [Terriglobales bacterium]